MIREAFLLLIPLLLTCIVWIPLDFSSALSSSNPNKTVLIYGATRLFGGQMYDDSLVERTCSKEIASYCSYTVNTNKGPAADAWLYHNRDFDPGSMTVDTSKVNIWMCYESPSNEEVRDFGKDSLNWTVGYRTDADFPIIPITLVPRQSEESVDLDVLWKMKNTSLSSAWMVSNCNAKNRRHDIARALQKLELAIDIFGDCSEFNSSSIPNCGRYQDNYAECAVETLKQYYFYLAFENSNCKDYVTEKFVNPLRYNYAVPIVMQRKIYGGLKIPEKSFIAVDDFGSLEEMVKYLERVKGNKEEYLSFYEWTKGNRAVMTNFSQFPTICDICQRLRGRLSQPTKSYSDIKDWYSTGVCVNDFASKYL